MCLIGVHPRESVAEFPSGNVRYFDSANGPAHYRVFVGKQLVDEWAADLRLPTIRLDSTSSTRRTIPGMALRPAGNEAAALDYVEIVK